jgi:hypothetical protein
MKLLLNSDRVTHRAPIAPLSAVSKETVPEGPRLGATAPPWPFPPVLWRLFSAAIAMAVPKSHQAQLRNETSKREIVLSVDNKNISLGEHGDRRAGCREFQRICVCLGV